jgi:prepilin-type N-terminal cleavage/methylation domain-containing protein
MFNKPSRERGFTLVEMLTVIALLAVLTTTAAIALGRMFGLWRQSRAAALIDQKTRQAMLDLSRELRSAGALMAPPGVSLGTGDLPSNILVYDAGEGRWCTVRLVMTGETTEGLVKETRTSLRGPVEPSSREVLIPEAVGFQVTYPSGGRHRLEGATQADVVGITVWVQGTRSSGGPRAYATAVNIPRLLWQGIE